VTGNRSHHAMSWATQFQSEEDFLFVTIPPYALDDFFAMRLFNFERIGKKNKFEAVKILLEAIFQNMEDTVKILNVPQLCSRFPQADVARENLLLLHGPFPYPLKLG
jgi:hypothetical protein